MANQVRSFRGLGKSSAFVLPTPLPTWASGLVSRGLRLLNSLRETEQVVAKQLSFISFLHWAVVRREQFKIFDESKQRPNQLTHDYDLFLSTFNGPDEPYIEAFTDVLGHAINFVWGFSVGYPWSIPETSYSRYIALNRVEADHHYLAYPGATVIDVRRCLHLHKELGSFAEQAKDLSDDQFRQAYYRLLLRVQNDLGSVGGSPPGSTAQVTHG
jgi:hypothetical protein